MGTKCELLQLCLCLENQKYFIKMAAIHDSGAILPGPSANTAGRLCPHTVENFPSEVKKRRQNNGGVRPLCNHCTPGLHANEISSLLDVCGIFIFISRVNSSVEILSSWNKSKSRNILSRNTKSERTTSLSESLRQKIKDRECGAVGISL